MKNSYIRLSQLWNHLSLPPEDNLPDKAEIMAYCKGIKIVREFFDEIFLQAFVETSSGAALSYYCQMLGIDGNLAPDEKKRLIKAKLNRKFGDYESSEFEKVVSDIDPDLSVVINDFVGFTTIYGTCRGKYDIFPRLTDAIDNYIPPCSDIFFSGDGFDFDYWDNTPYLFENFDNLKLSFDFIETLN